MKTKYAVTLAVLFAMVICLCLLQTASAADFSKSYSPGNGYVTQLAIQITSVLGGEQVTSLQLKNGGTVLASVDNQYVNRLRRTSAALDRSRQSEPTLTQTYHP